MFSILSIVSGTNCQNQNIKCDTFHTCRIGLNVLHCSDDCDCGQREYFSVTLSDLLSCYS